MNLAAARFLLSVMFLAFARIAVADTLPPIWTSAVGTPITSWNTGNADGGLATIYFPNTFVFPLFGQDYTSVTVSSDGSLYFGGAPNNSQPDATVPLLLQGLPRIAPAWYDIAGIEGNGAVLVNMLPGQAVITWEDVASYQPAFGSVPASNLATFQVTLDSNGTVIFAYEALNALRGVNSLVGSSQAIVGITDGFGAADPGSLDLSKLAETPGFSYTSSSNTIYQLIDNNPPDNSNLAGLDLIFTPQTGVGWTVTSYTPTSTPEPSTLAETAIAALALLVWRRRRSLTLKPCPGDIS